MMYTKSDVRLVNDVFYREKPDQWEKMDHKGKVLLKNKVLAVTKLLRMYKMLRQNNEAIVQLKQLTPNHKIPFGLLRAGKEEIKKAISSFEEAKSADLINEKRPLGKGGAAEEGKEGGAKAAMAAAPKLGGKK